MEIICEFGIFEEWEKNKFVIFKLFFGDRLKICVFVEWNVE